MVRLLLEAGAEKETARASDGEKPLHLATQNGRAQVVRMLQEAGAKTDCFAKLIAAQHVHTAVLDLLLQWAE